MRIIISPAKQMRTYTDSFTCSQVPVFHEKTEILKNWIHGLSYDEQKRKWQTHVHDTDEVVCYYGTDPDDPYNLNGEIEMIIGEENHILTKSSMIFLPAGLVHSGPLINIVNKPIFHFSLVLSPGYSFTGADGNVFEAK